MADCSFHGKEAEPKGSYVCFECGHVWKTAGEIIEAHREAINQFKNSPETYDAKKCALLFCPLCLHDWPPR